METPVIYFHSDKAFHAQIHVGFEGGTISQWYPNRSGGETLPEPPPSSHPGVNPVPLEKWRMDLAESTLTPAADGFPAPVYQSLKNGLAACGLLESEANAMVQTWWTSYFESEGLRVFWVLPTPVTDRILPLTITPPPDRIVRVLVGRSEVLRPRQETTWLAASRVTALRSAHEHEARLNANP